MLTPGQVAGIATQGTPAGTTAAEWVAKARQESSFDETADNGTAAGLWQVNYRAHPQYGRGKLKDPWYCWQATRAIYAKQGWQAWAASGGKPTPTAADRAALDDWDPKYAKPSSGIDLGFAVDHLDELPGAVIGAALDPVELLAGYVRDGVEVVVAAGEWIADPHNMARAGLVAGGAVLALLAAGVVVQPQATKVAGEVAGAAITKGKS